MKEKWHKRLGNELKGLVPASVQLDWTTKVQPRIEKTIEPIKENIADRRYKKQFDQIMSSATLSDDTEGSVRQDTGEAIKQESLELDETAKSVLHFHGTRDEMIAFVREYMKGQGGANQLQADEALALAQAHMVESFYNMATLIANDKELFDEKAVRVLTAEVATDSVRRGQALKKMVHGGGYGFHFRPARDSHYLKDIVYSFADPLKSSVVNYGEGDYIKIMSWEEAKIKYAELLDKDIRVVLSKKTPNIAEFGDPKANAKRAVGGLAAAAVVALIFSGKK